MAAAIITCGWLREGFAAIYEFGEAERSTSRISLFDAQFSIVNWFQSSMLLLAALMAFSAAERSAVPAGRYWLCLSGILMFLSVDEISALHDYSRHPLSLLIGSDHTAVWLSVMALVAVGVALCFRPLLRTIPGAYAGRFIWSAAIFLGGAVGLELVSTGIWIGTADRAAMTYILAAGAEETAEVIGITMHVRTMLAYLEEQSASIHSVF